MTAVRKKAKETEKLLKEEKPQKCTEIILLKRFN